LLSGSESPLQAFLQQDLQLGRDGISQPLLTISYNPAGLHYINDTFLFIILNYAQNIF